MSLTQRNKVFAQEYIANGYNATAAYIAATNLTKEEVYGDKKKQISATNSACAMLKKPEVREYIDELQKERFENLHINADRIATELATMAFSPIGGDVSENGKLRALELLQKQLGLQNQKIEANIKETIIEVTVSED